MYILKNREKGITMIALAVTIIVLMILAGVSINMIVGDNGIIIQAQRAERETVNATVASEEQMNILVEEMNGYLTVSGVFEEVVTSANYGDYVDYPIDINNDGDTTNDWRIFYNDGEHVYIIAADYIKSNSSYLDLETGEMYAYYNTNSSYIYSINWYNEGSTLNNHTGNRYIDSSIANLFMYNRYYTAYPSANNINAQATASLLDTAAWDGFVNSAYADYAIGGPTLETWVASYNAKGYTPLYTNINENGYYIGSTENPTTTYCNISNNANTGYNDKLYFPHKEAINNCYGYWLASPSADNPDYVIFVRSSGRISNYSYSSDSRWVRPLVSLKSDITATRSLDEIWVLSN